MGQYFFDCPSENPQVVVVQVAHAVQVGLELEQLGFTAVGPVPDPQVLKVTLVRFNEIS